MCKNRNSKTLGQVKTFNKIIRYVKLCFTVQSRLFTELQIGIHQAFSKQDYFGFRDSKFCLTRRNHLKLFCSFLNCGKVSVLLNGSFSHIIFFSSSTVFMYGSEAVCECVRVGITSILLSRSIFFSVMMLISSLRVSRWVTCSDIVLFLKFT